MGCGDGAEPGGSIGVSGLRIGVQLASEAPVCAADVCAGRAGRDAQHLIGVFGTPVPAGH
jgi:hypothetical protein